MLMPKRRAGGPFLTARASAGASTGSLGAVRRPVTELSCLPKSQTFPSSSSVWAPCLRAN